MTTKITNKQVKIVDNVDFNNKEIINATIDATKNNITNLDTGLVNDVQVNGTSIVDNKVANIQIKTINGNSINGEGNIAIKTYQPFNSTWTTNTTFSAFMAAVKNDSTAVTGMAYLGELRCSDLPDGLINVEAVVEVMTGDTASTKVIHTTLTSGNLAPYRWEYTYWNNGNSVSGWIKFQLELVNGINIKSINGESLLGSGNIAIVTNHAFNPNWHNSNSYTTFDFCESVNADSNAIIGMSYIGSLKCNDIPIAPYGPSQIRQGDATVKIIGQGSTSKIITIELSSSSDYPYKWQITYHSHTIDEPGWIGFQPELPSQTGNNGKFLTTNGSAMSWSNISDALTYNSTTETLEVE